MTLVGSSGSLTDLARAVRARTVTAQDLVDRALARLAEVEPSLRAFTLVDEDGARALAARLDADAAAGAWRGPLHGIPVAVKDLFDVQDQVTGAGSRVPPTGLRATADADTVQRLRRAGAVVLGRTRTHEYAWGLTTQHDVLGGTHNPYDLERVPGGSSGGSAAAVAAGVVPLALGTDTAGSIRLPAAWCGLVGHKPTHGRVSLRGAVPLAPALDHAGALVASVPDARLALGLLTGAPVVRTRTDLTGLRIGSPVDATLPTSSNDVARAVRDALATADSLGADVREVAVPPWALLREVFLPLQSSQALPYHRGLGHWPSRQQEYDAGVRSRLRAAERVTDADVLQAQDRLAALRRAVQALFDEVDVLVQPVAGTGPSRCSDPDVVSVDGEPADLRSQVLPYTLLASLCGLPACSVPAGLDADGLPVGVQVIGCWGRDDLVLDVAELVVPGRPR